MKSSIAPELVTDGHARNTVDVYSFGCVVNEIFSEMECYCDHPVTTLDDVSIDLGNYVQFYTKLVNGLRPTISDQIPTGDIES